MNIYVNDEIVRDLSEWAEELKSVFPLFFDKNNPRPVIIKYARDEYIKVGKKRGHNGREYMIEEPPAHDSIKCFEFKQNDSGTYDSVVLSQQGPIVNPRSNKVEYKDARIRVGRSVSLWPGRDLAKLIFLYKFSSRFRNGERANPSARLEFSMPELASRAKIENVKLRHQLEADILLGGVDSGFVDKVLRAFGLDVTAVDEINRTTLFEFVLGSRAAQESYFNMKDSDSQDGKLADVLLTVREAVDRGAIVQENGNWCPVGKTGVGRAMIHADPLNPIESLAKAAVADPTILARIENALSKKVEV